MDYMTLGDALHAMAEQLGLPDVVANEKRVYTDTKLPFEYWEQQYLHAWKYSYVAALLHQCISNSESSRIRWWSRHPSTGFAVIGDAAEVECMSALASRGIFVCQQQEIAALHAIEQGIFGKDGVLRVPPRLINTKTLLSGLALAFDLQSVGLIKGDWEQLAELNDLIGGAHSEVGEARSNIVPNERLGVSSESATQRNERWLAVCDEERRTGPERGAQARAVKRISESEGARAATVKKGIQTAEDARKSRYGATARPSRTGNASAAYPFGLTGKKPR